MQSIAIKSCAGLLLAQLFFPFGTRSVQDCPPGGCPLPNRSTVQIHRYAPTPNAPVFLSSPVEAIVEEVVDEPVAAADPAEATAQPKATVTKRVVRRVVAASPACPCGCGIDGCNCSARQAASLGGYTVYGHRHYSSSNYSYNSGGGYGSNAYHNHRPRRVGPIRRLFGWR